eukprot:scaffold269_cov229-Pinguiococcus_pyrenoidosus.AAC.11
MIPDFSKAANAHRRKKSGGGSNSGAALAQNISVEAVTSSEPRYCFCRNVAYGEMVGCDNDNCPYEWFHLECLGLSEPPPDNEPWFCPECRGKT